MLFVCENNLYAMGTALGDVGVETDIQRKAACYRIASEAVDGMDVVAVGSRRAPRRPRGARERQAVLSGMPHLPLAAAFHVRAQLYRDKAEVEAWRHKEPIVRFQGWLEAAHMIHPDDLARNRSRGRRRDRRGRRLRRARNLGAGRAAHPLHLLRPSRRARDAMTAPSETVELTYRDAMREAIRDAMRRDERGVPDGRGCRPLRRLLSP